jgi:hypothetical protein
MTASDTFATEWTDAEAWYAAHPRLKDLSELPRAEVIRLMAVSRTVAALEGEEATFSLSSDPAAAAEVRANTTGTVIGRSLLGDLCQRSRWLVLVRDRMGQVWALPEDQVVDIADAV